MDVNLRDDQVHGLELYLLDWDNAGRAEQVQISDATTGAVLSTQSVSSFQSGLYLDYAVSGHVVITITGYGPVLNGLFLDPPPPPPQPGDAGFDAVGRAGRVLRLVPLRALRLALDLHRRGRGRGQRQRLHRRQPRRARRAARSPSSRQTGSFSQAVAGWAAGTYSSPSRRRSGATTRPRGRTSRSWSTASWSAPSRPRARRTQLHHRRVHGRRRVAHDHLPGAGHRRRRQHRLHRRRPAGPGARAAAVADAGFEQPSVGAGPRSAYRPPARPGPSPAAPASRPTAAASPPATRRPARAARSPSSRRPARSARRSPAGPPAPTSSPSTPPSGATTRRRGRTSRSWSTASSSAPSRPSGTSYQTYTTAAFTVAAGAHTITFQGLDTAGGDNTAFVDARPPSRRPARAAVADAGFEQAAVGAGQLPVPARPARPGPSPAAPASRATAAASPSATRRRPEGGQVAFLQTTGSFSQAVAGWAAGTYALTFDAAQRGNYQASRQDFQVLVDGVVVGTFTPAGTSYQPTPPPRSPSPPGRTRSPSRAWTPPAATTPPSSTTSTSRRPEPPGRDHRGWPERAARSTTGLRGWRSPATKGKASRSSEGFSEEQTSVAELMT